MSPATPRRHYRPRPIIRPCAPSSSRHGGASVGIRDRRAGCWRSRPGSIIAISGPDRVRVLLPGFGVRHVPGALWILTRLSILEGVKRIRRDEIYRGDRQLEVWGTRRPIPTRSHRTCGSKSATPARSAPAHCRPLPSPRRRRHLQDLPPLSPARPGRGDLVTRRELPLIGVLVLGCRR
jgi:hypothetical protein